jgi:hypothetical protein
MTNENASYLLTEEEARKERRRHFDIALALMTAPADRAIASIAEASVNMDNKYQAVLSELRAFKKFEEETRMENVRLRRRMRIFALATVVLGGVVVFCGLRLWR